MNYTNIYHLPQWEKSDRILMDDFNQAMGNIEAGLGKVEQNASSSASSLAGSAASAATKAQETADSAIVKADAAQAAADKAFSPDYMPYKTGAFVGNGTSIFVELGFRPSFVIITCQTPNTFADSVKDVTVVGPGGNMSGVVSLSSTGMTLTYVSSGGHPHLNEQRKTYSYIAFR